MNPELEGKIAVWRQKALAGTLTLEEMREGIAFMRADRMHAKVSSTSAVRARATKAIKPADDLIDELENL